MEKFIILPDVTCDLSEELRKEYGLVDYVNGYVHINTRSIVTTLDWSNISRNEFYSTLANKKNKVTSAVASPEEFYQKFKKYASLGYSIISMSISSKISGTYDVSLSAANRIKEEFPDINIHCVDSRRMSGSFGLLVLYALQMQKEGRSYDEIVCWLEENKYRVHQMGPIDDLTFIARRGQISKGKAIMGNLVGIKPMGDCNADGYVTVLAKVKGIKKAFDITAAYVKKTAVDIENQIILISHSDREQYANTLKEKLLQTISCKNIYISDVFSGCGTNIGPGMIGVYFLGNPISDDVIKEKEIMNSCLEDNE